MDCYLKTCPNQAEAVIRWVRYPASKDPVCRDHLLAFRTDDLARVAIGSVGAVDADFARIAGAKRYG